MCHSALTNLYDFSLLFTTVQLTLAAALQEEGTARTSAAATALLAT
jgi:hypothetical protein